MVRRIVALLLLAVWQLQAAVPPHIHPGMSAKDLIAHGGHRHFHWSHESHAHYDHAHQYARGLHDHGDSQPLATLPAGHDDNAVYLSDGWLANFAGTSPHLAPLEVAMFAASFGDATHALLQHTSAPPRYGGQVPAFLSTTRLLL